MKAVWIITEAVARMCSSKGLQLYLIETPKQLLGTLFLQNTSGGWFSDYICLAERVKFAFLIFNYGENSKCYVNHVFWKVFKNSMKLLTSPFLVMLQNFLLEKLSMLNRALQGHSKALKALGYLALKHLSHLSHFISTWRAVGHSGTWKLEGH